jgi:hypothetical protein
MTTGQLATNQGTRTGAAFWLGAWRSLTAASKKSRRLASVSCGTCCAAKTGASWTVSSLTFAVSPSSK